MAVKQGTKACNFYIVLELVAIEVENHVCAAGGHGGGEVMSICYQQGSLHCSPVAMTSVGIYKYHGQDTIDSGSRSSRMTFGKIVYRNDDDWTAKIPLLT